MTAQSEQKSTGGRKLRVLVVDNNPVDRADHVEDLNDWGYDPIVAEGEGKELLEDARRKAREHRCHAAIVDMRLYDDHDISDHSGLKLVPDLKPAKCFVVTGYGSLPASRDATEYGAVMIGKQEGSEAVRHEVEKALQDVGRSDFVIGPAGWLVKNVVPFLRSDERQPVQVDEIRDVLMMLFPQEKSVNLQDLPRSVPSSPTSGSGLHGSSVVARITPDKLASAIVKFASPNAIRRERENYDAYVVERIKNGRHPHMNRRKRFWNVGAVVYTSLGGDIKNIAQFQVYHRTHTAAEITAALRDFFMDVWHPLYTDQSDLAGPLFEAYDRLWSRTDGTGPLTALLDRWKGLDKVRSFEGLNGEFLEPRRWLADHVGASALPNLRQCIVHGDLHGRNFFVDMHGNTWVIDFERTGLGHVLADFVELEHDLLRELAASLDLPTLCRLVSGLVTPLSIDRRSLDDPLHFADIIPDLVASVKEEEAVRSEVRRVLQTIHELRKIAIELFKYENQQEYYWALSLDAMFGVQRLDRQSSLNEIDKAVRQKELLIASVVCQRLKAGDSTWPPPGWQQTGSHQQGLASSAKTSLLSTMPNTHDFDVFLCHTSADKPEVKEIGRQLRNRGIRPWLDEWELPPGRPWQRELERQIARIRAAAIFVGANRKGPWMQLEQEAFLREFVKRGCPVIPVLLRSLDGQPPSLPIFLEGMGWVDFRKSDPDPLQQLVWGIVGTKPA